MKKDVLYWSEQSLSRCPKSYRGSSSRIGLEHTVLNAKQNDQEAEIIAHAGHRGAITIATNMAGRGTDIKLEAGVAEIGGLMSSEPRATSRAASTDSCGDVAPAKGIQAPPNSTSRLRIRYSACLHLPSLTAILQRFRPPEGEPISARILNKSVETAQKRVEQRNYTIRKHTLEYDDVMNKQRQEIYAFRNKVLHEEDMVNLAVQVIESTCIIGVDKYLRERGQEGGWEPEELRQWLMQLFPLSFEEGIFDQDHLQQEEIEQMIIDRVVTAYKEKMQREGDKLPPFKVPGVDKPINPLENAMRAMMIRRIDQMWQEHLLRMDHLRADVSLRAVGQRDPLTEFKHEAFMLFDELGRNLRTEIAQDLFRFEVVMTATQRPTFEDLLAQGMRLETQRSLVEDLEEEQPKKVAANQEVARENEKITPIVTGPRIGRNDDCPCGSGKKYKKCCGLTKEEVTR